MDRTNDLLAFTSTDIPFALHRVRPSLFQRLHTRGEGGKTDASDVLLVECTRVTFTLPSDIPAMPPSRPTTPIRRISRGSLSALLSQSRGHDNSLSLSGGPSNASYPDHHEPSPLSFLDESVGYLSDETSTLLTNLNDLSEIHSALDTFNEGFGMFLYGLRVAAYCIEWEESPQVESFQRAKERNGRVQ